MNSRQGMEIDYHRKCSQRLCSERNFHGFYLQCMKASAGLADSLITRDWNESQKSTVKCTSGNSLTPAGRWLKHFKRKGQPCLLTTPVIEAVCLGGFRTQTFIQSQKTVKTLSWMAYGQQLCEFLGEKRAGSASASSWYVRCLVNVSTSWGVTGTEWAVQSLAAKYFKANMLIYCSLEVKQLQNIWFWHQAWLCKDSFSKNSCVNWIYILNLDMLGCFYITCPESIEFSYIHTYIHGFGAAVGHEVYLIRKQKKKKQKAKKKKSSPLPTCIVHEIKSGFILHLNRRS